MTRVKRVKVSGRIRAAGRLISRHHTASCLDPSVAGADGIGIAVKQVGQNCRYATTATGVGFALRNSSFYTGRC